jgi:YD repeat-containing protein
LVFTSMVTQNGATIGIYVYNTMNERVAKNHGSTTTRFVYDQTSQLVSEASGSTRRDYIAVAGIPLAVADGASLGFIAADGLGSPRAVTSSTGAVVWTHVSGNIVGEHAALGIGTSTAPKMVDRH